MKRFYWVEIAFLFLNYTLMMNYLEELSIAGFILNIILLTMFTNKINYHRFVALFVVMFSFSYLIAESGGLNQLFKYFDVIIILLAINLALLFEILTNHKNIYDTIKPYCFVLMTSIIFFISALGLKDLGIFEVLYPYGSFSLFTAIALIFIPYLSTVTLSILFHN